MRCSPRILLIGLLLVPLSASGQKAPTRAWIVGVPATLGLIWPSGDRRSLRVDVSPSYSKTTVAGGQPSNSAWSVSANGAMLFYGQLADSLRRYSAVQLSYGWGMLNGLHNTDTYSAALLLGLDYRLGRRLATFGEVGPGISRTSQLAVFQGQVAGKSITYRVNMQSRLGLLLHR